MHYAVPRNACQPVARTNETDYSWVALIDNYYDCPDNVVRDSSYKFSLFVALVVEHQTSHH